MDLDSAIQLISQNNSTSIKNSFIFTSKRHEIDHYLEAVDQIQRSIRSGTESDQINAKSTCSIAMRWLTEEMLNILRVNGNSTVNDNSSTYSSTMTNSGSNSYIDYYEYDYKLSVEAINDLKSIVKRMNAAGYLLECKNSYVSARKLCVDASYRSLQKLDIQKFTKEDATTMMWKNLEPKIRVWMTSAKICFKKIFAYEKHLCEQIFLDIGDDTDVVCFTEIVNDYAFNLLKIVKNLSYIKVASERLFAFLDLYKTFSDLVPEMNELFNTNTSESLRTEANEILGKISRTPVMTIEKFEKDLLTVDLSKKDHPNDKILKCKYVMDYVSGLGQKKQILMNLCLSNPPSESSAEMNDLSFHMIWILTRLVSRLEDGAKSYKNDSDSNFFLMNNFHYIVTEIKKKSEVKEMVGDESLKKLSTKFDQVKDEYLRSTFKMVLSILGYTTSLQKRLKNFNAEFKELKTKLTLLQVDNFQLVMNLRDSTKEMLVPAYSSFLKQLNSSTPVKISAEDLKSDIMGFFSGPNR